VKATAASDVIRTTNDFLMMLPLLPV
jgi:hypothetical protein